VDSTLPVGTDPVEASLLARSVLTERVVSAQ
jgi:hypothetical protein